MSDVPLVCHMCAHTWGASGMLKNEKYGQFPFQRWHRRQKRTFLAPCGSVCVLDKNHGSEQKIGILAEVAENRIFLLLLRKWSYRSEFLSYKQSRTRRWKYLIVYFKILWVPKYAHTSGTSIHIVYKK